MSLTVLVTPEVCERAIVAVDRLAPAVLVILNVCSPDEVEWAFTEIGTAAGKVLSDILTQRSEQG